MFQNFLITLIHLLKGEGLWPQRVLHAGALVLFPRYVPPPTVLSNDWRVFAHLFSLVQILGLLRKLHCEREPCRTKRRSLYFGPDQRQQTNDFPGVRESRGCRCAECPISSFRHELLTIIHHCRLRGPWGLYCRQFQRSGCRGSTMFSGQNK